MWLVILNWWVPVLLLHLLSPSPAAADAACLTRTGKPCQLPFIYEGRQRWACITDHDPEGLAWCSTSVDAAGVHVTGSWEHCAAACQRESSSCLAVGGPAAGRPCIFPFIYEGVKQLGCVARAGDPLEAAGCSTAVDSAGRHLVDTSGDGRGDVHWGTCGSDCPLSGRSSCTAASGEGGECLAATACIGADLDQLKAAASSSSSCQQQQQGSSEATPTVCCPTVAVKVVALPPAETLPPAENLSEAEEDSLAKLFEEASQEAAEEEAEANQLEVGFRAGQFPAEEDEERRPSFFHQKFNKPRRDILQLDVTASLLQKVATKVTEDRKDLAEDGNDGLIGLRSGFNTATSRTIRRNCPWNTTRVVCDPSSPYRTMDGTCNNLKQVNYGRTGTPFQRILLPEYAGIAIHLPRRRPRDGFELPSARTVSFQLARGADPPDPAANTLLLMQMGQFVDHDLTHTPAYENLDCCNKGGKYPRAFNAEKCFPIRLSPTDPFWQGVTGCMDFFRSLSSPGLNCELQHREQLNQVTHWLDGSNIYGSTEADAALLRDGPTGRLRISTGRAGGSLLPTCSSSTTTAAAQPEACEACEKEDRSACFNAGDVRVNEQPNLVVLHTVFVREHNRLADILARLNPGWRPERLFQEARRITVAEYQHVVYKEWLPNILGNNYMRLFGLLPLAAGHSTDYQDDFDPRINNEFAAAAFRFGHSMVAGSFHMTDSLGSVQAVNLSDVFFKPQVVRASADSLDRLVRGLISEEPRAWDASFVEQLRDHLFETRPGRGGLDLVAINIQRGRDHGLPGYIRYVEICSGKKIADWADLVGVLGAGSVSRLQAIYRSPEDVDLFVGGFLEAGHEDALIGPVFKCIIGDQFARLKKGDRFFYDLGRDERTAFTAAQLDAVRTATMARLLCANTNVEAVQPFAFKMAVSEVNAVRACAEILSPPTDWSAFKEN